jgi:hypothetical protein
MEMGLLLTLEKDDTGFDPAYQTKLDAICCLLEDFEVIIGNFDFASLDTALGTEGDRLNFFLVVRHGC